MPTSALASRDRMQLALGRGRPDHVPFSPYISQGPYFREPLRWHSQVERVVRMLDLGLDPTVDIWLPDVRPSAQVRIKTWRERKGSDMLLTKEFHTPAGVLRQVVRETDDWCLPRHGPWIPTTFGTETSGGFGMHLFDDYNISRRLEPWVKGREDLEKLRYVIRLPEGHVLDEWRMDAQRAIELARAHGVLTVARRTVVGDAFQWFCDILWFLTQLVDDPAFVRDFLAVFQDWSLRQVQLALEAGVDLVQYRGWYEIPTYWGPRYFRELLAPLIEAQTRLVHQAGKIHGYLLPEGQGAYADILKDMSVDVLMGVDPRMLHGGDLATLAARLGEGKAFWGGVNAEVTLESRNPRAIEHEVRQAVETLGRRGGLILSAFLFPEVPHEGIMALIDGWKTCCRL